MNISDLIEVAAEKVGSQGALAAQMGKSPARLSEWKKGKHRPEPGEIMRLAELAGLPTVTTLLEIEAQLDEKHSTLWRTALGKLTAAGIAASFVATLTFSQSDAEACNLHADSSSSMQKGALYIM